jgi:hypothetical protein
VNQPYGGFPWIDMPMAANSTGTMRTILWRFEDIDAATLTDVQAFFKTYYAPITRRWRSSGTSNRRKRRNLLKNILAG